MRSRNGTAMPLGTRAHAHPCGPPAVPGAQAGSSLVMRADSLCLVPGFSLLPFGLELLRVTLSGHYK